MLLNETFRLRFYWFILTKAKFLGWHWLADWARRQLRSFKIGRLDNFGMTLHFTDGGVKRVNTDGSPYKW